MSEVCKSSFQSCSSSFGPCLCGGPGNPAEPLFLEGDTFCSYLHWHECPRAKCWQSQGHGWRCCCQPGSAGLCWAPAAGGEGRGGEALWDHSTADSLLGKGQHFTAERNAWVAPAPADGSLCYPEWCELPVLRGLTLICKDLLPRVRWEGSNKTAGVSVPCHASFSPFTVGGFTLA